MQTVSDAWKAAQLQNIVPESFIEISYRITDPAAEEDASASDNGHEDFADTSEILVAADVEYEKYAALEHNLWALDGTFPILPGTVTQNTGFVSSVLSGADATFSAPPVITLSFTEVHENAVPGVTITWSDAFDECANTFTVTAYNGSAQVASKTVTGNTANTVFVDMEISGYNRIEITVSEWCLPYHRARMEQLIVGAVQVFKKSDLLGYRHTQEIDLMSLQLPRSEIVFEISNVEGQWNPDNPQGVFKYLLERQQLSVRYGYKLGSATEWIAGGVFYMSEWETPQNGITASFTARDALEYMSNPYSASAGTYTLYALASDAFEQADIPLTPEGLQRWTIDDSLSSISVEIPTNEDGTVNFSYTCAEVVQLCANAACCIFYQDREGMIHIEKLSDALTDYLINGFVSYSNAEYDISKELKSVDVNEGMGSADNSSSGEVQTIENPLIQNASAANNVAEWIRGILSNRKSLSGDYRADPRLDAADKVTVSNKYATNTVFITNIEYTYNGAFRGSYEGRVMA